MQGPEDGTLLITVFNARTTQATLSSAWKTSWAAPSGTQETYGARIELVASLSPILSPQFLGSKALSPY